MKKKLKFYSVCFLVIIVMGCIYFALVQLVYTPLAKADGETETEIKIVEVKPKVGKVEELIPCSNPDGCVGKVRSEWPECPICRTPISSSPIASPKRGDNVTEEIVNLLDRIYLLNKDIGEIKIKKEEDRQKRLANMKSYDETYANKVYENLQVLTDAYERTKRFVQDGGEQVEGSLISSFRGGDPVWTEIKYFRTYPIPRPTTR